MKVKNMKNSLKKQRIVHITLFRNGKVNRSKIEHIYMVGGGTGITPLYQIVQFITEAES